MTTFSITIPMGNGFNTISVAASKYTVAPRSAPFAATVDGVKCDAWTTEGKGKSDVNNHYIYFRDSEALYYFKVPSAAEQAAARQSLVIESEEYAAKFKQPAPAAKKTGRRSKTAAA